MNQNLMLVAIVVKDYDEAIEFYTKKLNFKLIEDTAEPAKRWVVVSPPGSQCQLLLARASNSEQESRIGNQTGGRVFLFLSTDDFERDYKNLLKHDIRIIRPPKDEVYGRVAVFADLYGNLWDLIQPAKKRSVAIS